MTSWTARSCVVAACCSGFAGCAQRDGTGAEDGLTPVDSGALETSSGDEAGAEEDDGNLDVEAGRLDVNAGAEGSGGCLEVTVDFEITPPNIMLLLDRSNSMVGPFEGGTGTRWSAVRDVLFDATSGVVHELESEVKFGLALYRSLENQGVCPDLVRAPIALNNGLALQQSFDGNPAQRGSFYTPTGESLATVAAELAALNDPGTKVVILATDGEPTSCAVGGAGAGRTVAVEAATDAAADGVKTIVISVGRDVTDQHLQDMANAGAGWLPGDPDFPFYRADDQTQLADRFRQAIRRARSCVLSLDGEIQPGFEEQGTVTIDGEEVDLGAGWRVLDARTIELIGSACEAIKDGDPVVDVDFPCGGFNPG